jgi:predicted O-methyltransferase YrrM
MTEGKLAEICIFKGAYQKYKELYSLIAFITQRIIPQSILEIGTGKGGTFWLWCQIAASDGTIISIDLPDGNFGGGFSLTQQKQIEKYKCNNQKVYFIRGDSHNLLVEEKLLHIIEKNKIDLLFIDGDHTYNGVKEDFDIYSKYVKDNGIIVFHDIVEHDRVPECQVKKFWDYIKTSYKSYEFIDDEFDDRGWGNWGGIGVLIK